METNFRTWTLLSGVVLACCTSVISAEIYPRIASEEVGRKEGVLAKQFTLTNSSGIEAKVLTLGATLASVKVPDCNGNLGYVTLFREDPADYLSKRGVLGTVIGRFANRIAGAKFTLDGKQYQLAANSQGNHIHGGRTGFHTQVWEVAEVEQRDNSVGVRLGLTSPDGHEGYPGTLQVQVLYRLTEQNEIWMDYTATTDKPTHVNLTNHAYWNLKGHGDVLNHQLHLNADRYLPSDKTKVPLGNLADVTGTAMDFREPKTIGSRIEQVKDQNYDHCYVLNKNGDSGLTLAARVEEPSSGRVMEVFTTQPGVQLYTARGMKFSRDSLEFGSHPALCLETQHFPNAPNEPEFPSTVLRPGETFRQTTMHRFSTRD